MRKNNLVRKHAVYNTVYVFCIALLVLFSARTIYALENSQIIGNVIENISQQKSFLLIILPAILLLVIGIVLLLLARAKEAKEIAERNKRTQTIQTIEKKTEPEIKQSHMNSYISSASSDASSYNSDAFSDYLKPKEHEEQELRQLLEQERRREEQFKKMLEEEQQRREEQIRLMSQQLTRKKEQLADYVRSLGLAGYSKDVIKARILKAGAGWPQDIVEEVMSKAYVSRTDVEIDKLSSFIQSQLSLGKSEEEIRQFLSISNWSDELIDAATKKIKKKEIEQENI